MPRRSVLQAKGCERRRPDLVMRIGAARAESPVGLLVVGFAERFLGITG